MCLLWILTILLTTIEIPSGCVSTHSVPFQPNAKGRIYYWFWIFPFSIVGIGPVLLFTLSSITFRTVIWADFVYNAPCAAWFHTVAFDPIYRRICNDDVTNPFPPEHKKTTVQRDLSHHLLTNCTFITNICLHCSPRCWYSKNAHHIHQHFAKHEHPKLSVIPTVDKVPAKPVAELVYVRQNNEITTI